jgi:predicted NAD/FAD-binding protein
VSAGTRIAVIGGGASGLLSAWALSERHAVTLYESSDSLGGSVRTIKVEHGRRAIPIETGFAQFAPPVFPRFAALLELLGIRTRASGASLTVARTHGNAFVWPPRRPAHLPSNLGKLRDFVRMLRRAKQLVATRNFDLKLGEWAASVGLSTQFLDEVLYPFASVSRALPPARAAELAAYPLLAYLVMPGLQRPPSWRVIDGGSRRYIDALARQLRKVELRLSTPVRAVSTNGGSGVRVIDPRGADRFDQVVVATEAWAARELLAEHPAARARVDALGRLSFYPVINVVHSDPRLMPARRTEWSLANVVPHGEGHAFTSWVGHDFDRAPIFRGWTTGSVEDVEHVHEIHRWRHLEMTPEVAKVQASVERDQGVGQIWLTGLYTTDIDSHESAVRSALRVIEALAPDSTLLAQLRGT